MRHPAMSHSDVFGHGEAAHWIKNALLTRSRDFAMVTFSATVTLALEVRRTTEPDPQFVQAIAESERTLERVRNDNKLARDALSILQELRKLEDHHQFNPSSTL
jgi:hypothetical protein